MLSLCNPTFMHWKYGVSQIICNLIYLTISAMLFAFIKKEDSCLWLLNGASLISVDSIRDLGNFLFKVNFWSPYPDNYWSDVQNLGFVMRTCKFFKNINMNIHTLKLLYCALVRPHLEFATVVWAPYHANYCKMIEGVQHRFLRRISFLTKNPM